MKVKSKNFEKLKITDNSGYDLLVDEGIRNLMSVVVSKMVSDIEKKKQEAFLNRLKELGINFYPEEDQSRRFKRFTKEIINDDEVIYYDDGSLKGLKVITFRKKHCSFNPDELKIDYEITIF